MAKPAGGIFVELGLDMGGLRRQLGQAGKEVQKAVDEIQRRSKIHLTAPTDLGDGAPVRAEQIRGRVERAKRDVRNRLERQRINEVVRRELMAEGIDPALAGFRVPPAARRFGMIAGGVALASRLAQFPMRQAEAHFRDYRDTLRGFQFSGQQAFNDPTLAGLARQATEGSSLRGSLVSGTLGRVPFLGNEIAKQFERAADSARRLAEAHARATQLTNDTTARQAAASGRPIEAFQARQAIERTDALNEFGKASRAARDTYHAGRFFLEPESTFRGRVSRANAVARASEAAFDRLTATQEAELGIEREVYGGRLGMLRAGGTAAMARTRAANQRFAGNAVGAFATGLGAQEIELGARQRAELAGLRGEERTLVNSRHTFERAQMEAERRNSILGFVGAMPSAQSAGGFDMLGAGQLGALRQEQAKTIEDLLTQVVAELKQMNADGGMN